MITDLSPDLGMGVMYSGHDTQEEMRPSSDRAQRGSVQALEWLSQLL